jgi:hypothetical protein
VNLQIASHNAGAQRTGGFSEARDINEVDNKKDDDEMEHPRICPCSDHVPGRMRQEAPSTPTPAATRTDRSYGLALG